MAAEMTMPTARMRAYHEAGHAVLAAQLAVDVERVSIVPAPVGRSHVKLAGHPGLDVTEELAGEAAMRRLEDGEPVAASDREHVQGILTDAGIDEAQGRQMFTEGRERATRLLADAGTWRRVETAATALLAEGTLDGGRFRDLLAGA